VLWCAVVVVDSAWTWRCTSRCSRSTKKVRATTRAGALARIGARVLPGTAAARCSVV
jgi:hypothetical protein